MGGGAEAVGSNDRGMNLAAMPVRYQEPLDEWPPDQIARLERVGESVFILKLRFTEHVGVVQFRLQPGDALDIQDSAER